MYREFVVPEYHEFVDSLGLGPEPLGDEDAYVLRFDNGDEALVLTLDLSGRSVHCRWTRGPQQVLELFREGATQVRLDTAGGASIIDISFQTEALKGHLRLQVSPGFAIDDRLLFA